MWHISYRFSVIVHCGLWHPENHMYSEADGGSSQRWMFLRGRVVSPLLSPLQVGLGYPYLSGSSPLTCLVWQALRVGSYRQYSSQDHLTTQSTLLRKSGDAFRGFCVKGWSFTSVICPNVRGDRIGSFEFLSSFVMFRTALCHTESSNHKVFFRR
jgi:hypothetical protein